MRKTRGVAASFADIFRRENELAPQHTRMILDLVSSLRLRKLLSCSSFLMKMKPRIEKL